MLFFYRVLVTSRIVRWRTAIWCEPEFFVKWVLSLATVAKNSGWQIALIFLLLFSSRKKVISLTLRTITIIACLSLFVLEAKSIFINSNKTFNDSLIKKYPLSDPRNPNCPCHKYQKKAEKEFHKLNKHKQKSVATGSPLSHPKRGVTSHFPYFYSQRTYSLNRRGSLKKTSIHKLENRKKGFKFSFKKRPDSCPKWQFRR